MPIKSMTGYGTGVAGESVVCKAEIRTVNHRYLDTFIRCPKEYSLFEDKIRRLVQQYVARGRVEVCLNIEDFGSGRRTVKINADLAAGYLAAFREIEDLLGIQVDGSVIPTLPDVLAVEEIRLNPEEVWIPAEAAVRRALESLVAMRTEEGTTLAEDILTRLQVFESLIDQIALRAPEVIEQYRKRLERRIEEMCGFQGDPGRLAMEVAMFADRSAIDEEIVRTKSHINQMREILGQNEPIGRKLDFLIQEMNREVNTIGSKSPDAEVSQLVVDSKSELEKIREQVQNVE